MTKNGYGSGTFGGQEYGIRPQYVEIEKQAVKGSLFTYRSENEFQNDINTVEQSYENGAYSVTSNETDSLRDPSVSSSIGIESIVADSEVIAKAEPSIGGKAITSGASVGTESISHFSPTISVDGILGRVGINKEGIASVGQTIDSTALSTEIDLYRGALSFDGNSHVALDMFFNSSNIGSFTGSAWVRIPDGGGDWSILDFDRSEYFTLTVGIPDNSTSGTGRYVGFHGSGDMWSDQKLDYGTIHHITWVHDAQAGEKRIYIDGEFDSSASHTGIGNGTTRYGFIGDGSEANSYNGSRNNIGYEGDVDDIRYFGKNLSELQIQALASGKNITDGIIAHWSMNKTSGSFIYDIAGNHDGELFGPTRINTLTTPGGLRGRQTSPSTTVQGSVTASIDKSDVSAVEPSPTSNTDDAFVKPLSGQINLKGYLSQTTAEHAIISSVSNELVSTTEQAIGMDPVTAQTSLSDYNLHTAGKSPTTSSILTELTLDNSRIRLQEKSSVLLKSTNATTGMSPDIANADERQISTTKTQASVSITQDSVSNTGTPISSAVGIVSTRTNAGSLGNVEPAPVVNTDDATVKPLPENSPLSGKVIATDQTSVTKTITHSGLVAQYQTIELDTTSAQTTVSTDQTNVDENLITTDQTQTSVFSTQGIISTVQRQVAAGVDKISVTGGIGSITNVDPSAVVNTNDATIKPLSENSQTGEKNITTKTDSVEKIVDTESVFDREPSIPAFKIQGEIQTSLSNQRISNIESDVSVSVAPVSSFMKSQGNKASNIEVDTGVDLSTLGILDQENVLSLENKITTNSIQTEIDSSSGESIAIERTVETSVRTASIIQDSESLISSGRSHSMEALSVSTKMMKESESIRASQIGVESLSAQIIPQPAVYDSIGANFQTSTDTTTASMLVGPLSQNGQLEQIAQGIVSFIPQTENGNIGGVDVDTQTGSTTSTINTEPVISTGLNIDANPVMTSASLSAHNGLVDSLNPKINAISTGVSTASESLSYQIYQPIVETTGFPISVGSGSASIVEPEQTINTDDSSISPHSGLLGADGSTIETDSIGQIPVQYTTESISTKATSIDIDPVTSAVIASTEIVDSLGPVISTNANETDVNISVDKDTTDLDEIAVGVSAQTADVEVSESKTRIETAPIDTEVGVSSVSLSEHNSPLSGKRVDMNASTGVTVRTESMMLSGVEPQPIVSTDDASIKPFADNLKATGLTIETNPIEATSNISQESVYTTTNKFSLLATNTTTNITNDSLDSDSFQIDLTSDITSLSPEPSQIHSEVFNIDTSASTAGFSVTNDVLSSQGMSPKLNAQVTQVNPTTHNLNKNGFSPSLSVPSVVSTILSNESPQAIGKNIEIKTDSVTGTFDVDSMEQIEDTISFDPIVSTVVVDSHEMYSTGAKIKTTTDLISSTVTISTPVLVESTPTVNADDTDIGVRPETIIQYGERLYFDTQNKATAVVSNTDLKTTETRGALNVDTVDVSPTISITQTDEKNIDTSVSRSAMDITEGHTDTFDPQTTVNVTRAKSVMSNEKIPVNGVAVTTDVDSSTATIESNGVDQIGRQISSGVDTATVVTQSPQTQMQETNLKIPVIDTVSANLGSEEIPTTNVHIHTSVSPIALFSDAETDDAKTPLIEGESQGTVQTLLGDISVDIVESNATFGLTPVSTVQSVEIPSLSEEEIKTIADSTTSSIAIDTIGDGEHTVTTDTGSSSVNANLEDISIDDSKIQSIVDTVTAGQSIGNIKIKGSLDAVYQTFLVEGLSVVIGERDRSRLLQGDYKGLAIVSGERERSRIVGGKYDRQTILEAIRDRYRVIGDR